MIAVWLVVLVLVVVAVGAGVGWLASEPLTRRSRALWDRAEDAHAVSVLTRAARLAEDGTPAELDGYEAGRIVEQAERAGRYGYEALLITWRQVADTLPADVVAAVEGRLPRPPAPQLVTAVEESGGPYGRVIRHLSSPRPRGSAGTVGAVAGGLAASLRLMQGGAPDDRES